MDIKEFAFRGKFVERCLMTEDCMCSTCEQEKADDWADNGFDDGEEDDEDEPMPYSDRVTPIDKLVERWP